MAEEAVEPKGSQERGLDDKLEREEVLELFGSQY